MTGYLAPKFVQPLTLPMAALTALAMTNTFKNLALSEVVSHF